MWLTKPELLSLGAGWGPWQGEAGVPNPGGVTWKLWSCHLLTERRGHPGHPLGITTGSVGPPSLWLSPRTPLGLGLLIGTVGASLPSPSQEAVTAHTKRVSKARALYAEVTSSCGPASRVPGCAVPS